MPRTTLNSTSPYFIGSRAFDVPETRQHGSRDRLQVNRCHGQLSSTTSAAALDGSPASPRRQSSSGLRENFLDAVAGAALEGPLLKAELAGRDSNQSHLVFAGRTRRSLTNRRCHHSHANRGWGPEQEIPDPCTDRNDSLKVRRLVSAVPTIIGKSHGALTVSNLSQLGVLSSVYNHFPSDHTKGALAVRYFRVEVCVGRGVDSFRRTVAVR
jgi:hypothetical protein